MTGDTTSPEPEDRLPTIDGLPGYRRHFHGLAAQDMRAQPGLLVALTVL